MSGGGWHSVPTKEDFKAEIKSNIFIYVPIAVVLICLLAAFAAVLGTTAYCIWTDDFSSLGTFAYFLGKLLAMTIALFAWLIVMLVIKGIRAMWGKM